MAVHNVNLMQADGGTSKKKSTFDWEAYQRQQQAENMMASQSSANHKPSTYSPSGGGSGSGTKAATGTSTGSSNAFDMSAYLSALAAEQRARAQAAYDRNMARIASAFDSAAGNLKGNYDSAVDRLNAARDKSMGDVKSDAENSLREAYINKMMTDKNLNQRLSAMGYNGGATESTMSSLANQYGKSRTGINETLNKNIADLDMTYGDNLAKAIEAYNSAMANLQLQKMQMEVQAENALSNSEASSINSVMNIDGSYMNALQTALANQMGYTYDPTQATNEYVAGNARQAQSAAGGNDYAKWLAQQLLTGGNSATDVANYMVSRGYGDSQTLADILKQLGATA